MTQMQESRTIQRRSLIVHGIVQGVGFRPFVYRLALRYRLAGFVLNDSRGVTIEIEGPPAQLDTFEYLLRQEAPPLARIDTIASWQIEPRNETTFRIVHSQESVERSALISPDTATCDDCLRELFDPCDRRYVYPFINCTNCGPRFTIVQDIPYDRRNTTMQAFPMCPNCQTEYDDPLSRRFHAQPNACPQCGPQVALTWITPQTTETRSELHNVIATAAHHLAMGEILAIKGLGGYHLACDALNNEAVTRLRQRKHREAKPFALMVPNVATASQFCEINAQEAALLCSRQRPIVLMQQKSDAAWTIAPAVTPAYNTIGIMLPYTPLHHLLLASFANEIPPARQGVLVMTSGNLSEEPIAYRDSDAYERLSPIVQGIVTHNRTIHMRCDDSVLRVAGGGIQFFRRSRGYAPEPIPLADPLPLPLLACGGHLKNTFCVGKERHAFMSHHIGDLENLETLTSYQEGIEHFQRLFAITPEAIAYDLHPDYLATKYALDSPITTKIGVQHHHAHIASVIAEHGLHTPVIGVAADGTGYGTDGTIWGCEIMRADLVDFDRLVHLNYIPLPGGEQAVHQPWRVAAAYLHQTYGPAFLDIDIPFVRQLDRRKWHTLEQMITRGINSPRASSLGRLFDAVAALLDLRSDVLYEGQAAIELEMLAAAETDWQKDSCYPCVIQQDRQPALLDTRPLFQAIVHDIQHHTPLPRIAIRFHRSIAELLAQACIIARTQTGLHVVAMSGGVFQNRLLLELLQQRLRQLSFEVYINQRVPPNDGGLALGQLAVAAARLRTLGKDARSFTTG